MCSGPTHRSYANEVYKTNNRAGQILCMSISHDVDNEGMKSQGEQLILDTVKGKESVDDVWCLGCSSKAWVLGLLGKIWGCASADVICVGAVSVAVEIPAYERFYDCDCQARAGTEEEWRQLEPTGRTVCYGRRTDAVKWFCPSPLGPSR